MLSLCFVPLRQLPSDRASAESVIRALPFGQAERERLQRISHPLGFRQSLGGLIALQRLVQQQSFREPPIIGRTPNGKPFFLNDVLPSFSLSHSGEWAVACLGSPSDGSVGIDLEWVRPNRNLIQLSERFFSVSEQLFLRQSQQLAEDFYLLWTKKEAYAKLTGQGIFDGCRDSIAEHIHQKSFRVTDGLQTAFCTVACTSPVELSDPNFPKEDLTIDELPN